jgi:BASS family bile acid:Na+ symporter
MMTALGWIGKHATLLLALGVFVGLALPDLAALARPVLVPAILVMLVFSLLRLDPMAIAAAVRRPLHVLPAVGFALLLSPVLCAAVAWAIGLDRWVGPGVVLAMVVWAASPPLASVPALASILGLDGALALMAMTLGGLLMPLTLPPIILLLIGLDLEISVSGLMLRLIGLLLLAAVAAVAIRALLGARRIEASASAIDGAFVLVMLLFAVAVMDGVTAAAVADPVRVAAIVVLVFTVSLGLQAIAYLAFLPLGKRPATTVALVAGNRNVAIVFGAAPAAVHPDAFLYLALLQFPIYLLPALLRPLYNRLSA